MKKAQSVLEYSLLIGLVIMGFLGMQIYLGRGMQGKYQAATDQMADQYSHGVSDVHEHSQSEATIFEMTMPGWGAPKTFTKIRGSYTSSSERGVASLDKTWP